MELTFEKIKPLIYKKIVVDNNFIEVVFKAENQIRELTATAILPNGKIQGHENLEEPDEMVKSAIVNAFRTLCIFYDYDEENGKWIFQAPH